MKELFLFFIYFYKHSRNYCIYSYRRCEIINNTISIYIWKQHYRFHYENPGGGRMMDVVVVVVVVDVSNPGGGAIMLDVASGT